MIQRAHRPPRHHQHRQTQIPHPVAHLVIRRQRHPPTADPLHRKVEKTLAQALDPAIQVRKIDLPILVTGRLQRTTRIAKMNRIDLIQRQHFARSGTQHPRILPVAGRDRLHRRRHLAPRPPAPHQPRRHPRLAHARIGPGDKKVGSYPSRIHCVPSSFPFTHPAPPAPEDSSPRPGAEPLRKAPRAVASRSAWRRRE